MFVLHLIGVAFLSLLNGLGIVSQRSRTQEQRGIPWADHCSNQRSKYIRTLELEIHLFDDGNAVL